MSQSIHLLDEPYLIPRYGAPSLTIDDLPFALLDGVNDFVDIPHVPWRILTEGTIAAWAKTTSSARQTILSGSIQGEGSSECELGFGSGATAGKIGMLVRDQPASLLVFSSDATYNDGNWHHVAWTSGPSGNILYVDGAPVAVTYSTGDASSSIFFGSVATIDQGGIGANDDIGGGRQWFFDGSLTRVGIWNRPLTAGEIATLFELGSVTSGRVSEYRFADWPGPNIACEEGNDGTATT